MKPAQKIITNTLLFAIAANATAFAQANEIHSTAHEDVPWEQIQQVCSHPAVEALKASNTDIDRPIYELYSDYSKVLAGEKLETTPKQELDPANLPPAHILAASKMTPELEHELRVAKLQQLDEAIALNGGNAYGYLKWQGNKDVLNSYAQYKYDMTDAKWLRMDTGLIDYATGKPLELGDVLHQGCLTVKPESPNKILVVNVDGKVNGAEFADISTMIKPEIAKQMKRTLPRSEFSQSQVHIDLENKFDGNQLLNFDTASANNFVTKNKTRRLLPGTEYQQAFTRDASLPFVFFHELRHTHLEDHTELKTLYNSSKLANMDLAEVSKQGHLLRNNLETNADAFAMGVIAKEIIKQGGDIDGNINYFANAVQNVRTSHQENDHEYYLLASKLFAQDTAEVAMKHDLSKHPVLIETIEKIKAMKGKEYEIQKTMFMYHIKNKYQTNHMIDFVVEAAKTNPNDFLRANFNDLHQLANNATSAVNSNTSVSAFLQTPGVSVFSLPKEEISAITHNARMTL